MTRRVEWLLRAVAVGIMLAGAIDPVFMVKRTTPPIISLRSSGMLASTVRVDDVRRALAPVGTVVTGPVPNAQATVVLGSDVPPDLLSSPVMPVTGPVVVVPLATPGGLTVEATQVPASAHLSERSTVQVRVHRQRDGRTGAVQLELRSGGLLRAVRSDRVMPGQRLVLAVPFTPFESGAQHLELRVVDGRDTIDSPHALHVTTSPWRVLFLDTRPSWLSTFMRRALERDTRFAVSYRVGTSTNVSVATPQVVRDLDALRSLAQSEPSALPELVVLGAPEHLSQQDVSTLRVLVEQWGRAVLVLPDHLAETRSPVERLAQVALDSLLGSGGWRAIPSAASPHVLLRHVRAGLDSLLLRGESVAVPRALRDDAVPLVQWQNMVVAWYVQAGAGVVATSGALDSWRFRDAERSTFDQSWREIAARLAASAQPALRLSAGAGSSHGTAGALRTWYVTRLHDDGSTEPEVRAIHERGDTVRLAVYPTADARLWRAQGRLQQTGRWTLVASSLRDTASLATLVVANPSSAASTSDITGAAYGCDLPPTELLDAWTRATGGRLLATTALDELPTVVKSLLPKQNSPSPQPAPWHPMRSAWWILPLTLALGGEWWLRRWRGAR
jgi:hypothetical protein